MNADLSSLPDDAHVSKQDLVKIVDSLEVKYQEKINYLEERIRLLQNDLFGRKSEKHYPGYDLQMPIFEASDQAPEPKADDTIVVAAHKRKKRGRKPLPDNLPRVEVIHDIPEGEKVCACGATLSRICVDSCE